MRYWVTKSTLLAFSLVSCGLLIFAYFFETTRQIADFQFQRIYDQIGLISAQGDAQATKYELLLEEQHVGVVAQKDLLEQNEALQKQIDDAKLAANAEELAKLQNVQKAYTTAVEKTNRNKQANLTTTLADQEAKWGVDILQKKYDAVSESITTYSTALDSSYTQYLATLPSPTARPTSAPAPPPSTYQPSGEYSYGSLQTDAGKFNMHVIKARLSEIVIKTISANTDNCTNNCPAKPLQQYVSEHNGFAGMHGSYFCPPDYTSCANKTYSFDFALYHTSSQKWINQHALSWNDLGLAAFNGSTPMFYSSSKNYGGQAVTAGISNFPSLVSGGNNVVNPSALTSYQRDVRGVRGGIGANGEYLFLVTALSATVPDMAHVFRALGATDALNLDGGGSAAMYVNGSYRVGPGRQLPNAIILSRK